MSIEHYHSPHWSPNKNLDYKSPMDYKNRGYNLNLRDESSKEKP